MKTVYDVRLNDYANQIVWAAPMINDYGDVYGHYYSVARPDKDFEEQVIIGYEYHPSDCNCDHCQGLNYNVYNQLYIADDMSPNDSNKSIW